MQLSKMKNIIVLKGMASNVVDEAIVVLKPNVNIKQSEYYNGKNKNIANNKNKKMILMKEAENTIDMYVHKLEKSNNKIRENNFKKKYRFLQISNCILILIILIASLISF